MRRASCALLVVSSLAAASEAAAQAWVAPKGQGAVSIAVQNFRVEKHLAATTEVAAGTIDSVSVLADVTYGLTDRISVDFALPYIASRYQGPVPHVGSTIDDEAFHGTFADMRFALRYNLTRKGAVITPYAGSSVPSHDYPFYGHAAAGMRLREYQVGAYVGKIFDRVPGLFVSGRYGYGFAQRAIDIKHDRSSVDLEVGYFLTPDLRAFGMGAWQHTHGGIDFPAAGVRGLPLVQQPVHDQIQQINYLKAGGGVAWSLSESVDLFGSASTQLSGRNGHAMKYGITAGVSWGFSLGGRANGDLLASAATARRPPSARDRERPLIRCICQKGRG
jgi:hypothetical protein